MVTSSAGLCCIGNVRDVFTAYDLSCIVPVGGDVDVHCAVFEIEEPNVSLHRANGASTGYVEIRRPRCICEPVPSVALASIVSLSRHFPLFPYSCPQDCNPYETRRPDLAWKESFSLGPSESVDRFRSELEGRERL